MSFDILRGTYSVNKLLVPLSNAARIKQRVYRRLNISKKKNLIKFEQTTHINSDFGGGGAWGSAAQLSALLGSYLALADQVEER